MGILLEDPLFAKFALLYDNCNLGSINYQESQLLLQGHNPQPILYQHKGVDQTLYVAAAAIPPHPKTMGILLPGGLRPVSPQSAAAAPASSKPQALQ